MSRSLKDHELAALNTAFERIKHPQFNKYSNAFEVGVIIDVNGDFEFPIYVPGSAVNLCNGLRHRMLLSSGEHTFSHYIPSQFALPTLENRRVFLRPLTQQTDCLEYEHCHAEAFAIWPLSRLKQSVNGEWNAARAVGRDIYVLCLTAKASSESEEIRFWQEYAGGNHTGVRIDFSYSPKTDHFRMQSVVSNRRKIPDYQLSVSHVVYDDGEILADYKEIRTALIKVGIETFLTGFSALATRFKRERFKWEKEVRIVLDTSGDSHHIRDGNIDDYEREAEENRTAASKSECITFDGNSSPMLGAYLCFDNQHFTLNVESVTCGANAADGHVQELREHCNLMNIPFVVNPKQS